MLELAFVASIFFSITIAASVYCYHKDREIDRINMKEEGNKHGD